MKRRKYLITSANSYGNVGDDICGYSAEYLVKHYDPTAKVVVTCPPYNAALVDNADVVIVGGGGVIYDHDMNNVENYMSYIEHAHNDNKLTAVLGVGIQGIGREEGKLRYRKTLTNTDIVTVRSPADEKDLNNIGVNSVLATQDLAFVTDEWVRKPNLKDKIRLKRSFKNNSKPNLGLAIVDLVAIKGDAYDEKSANFVDSLNDNLQRICEEFNVYLLVHSADDAKYYDQLQKKFDVRKIDYKLIGDLPYFWAAYQKMDLVIGSRFHSIILACLAGVPVVGVSSESTKQNRLANYDMPTLKSQRLVFSDMEGIKDLFVNLKNNFDAGKYKTITNDELSLAKKRAHQNGELIKEALNK